MTEEQIFSTLGLLASNEPLHHIEDVEFRDFLISDLVVAGISVYYTKGKVGITYEKSEEDSFICYGPGVTILDN